MTPEQNNRITARVSPEQLKLLNTAVKLSGSSSINNFILTSAIKEAKNLIIEDNLLKKMQEQKAYSKDQLDEDTIVLNKADALKLFEELENKESGNPVLKALIKSKLKNSGHISRTKKVRETFDIKNN